MFNFRIITAGVLAETMGLPLEDWHGNCHGVAMALADWIGEDAELVRGLFVGEFHRDSIFSGRLFTGHSWVVVNGQIIDPTRWTMTSPFNPRISANPPAEDYDRSGARLRSHLQAPPPPFDPDSRRIVSMIGDDSMMQVVAQVLGSFIVEHELLLSIDQMFWVANHDWSSLLSPVQIRNLYQMFDDWGCLVFVPRDLVRQYLGGLK